MLPTIILRLDPRTRHNLEQVSMVTGTSPGDLVAEGVRQYVDARVEELVAKGFLTLQDVSGEGDAPGGVERYNLIV